MVFKLACHTNSSKLAHTKWDTPQATHLLINNYLYYRVAVNLYCASLSFVSI